MRRWTDEPPTRNAHDIDGTRRFRGAALRAGWPQSWPCRPPTRRTALLRRSALGVRMDLISPCVGESSLSAPQPRRRGPEGDLQDPKLVQVVGKDLFRRRQLVHVREMLLQERMHFWPCEIVLLDAQGGQRRVVCGRTFELCSRVGRRHIPGLRQRTDRVCATALNQSSVQKVLCDDQLLDLARSVEDPKSANVSVKPFHYSTRDHTHTAKDLNCLINYCASRLGCEEFCHRGVCARLLTPSVGSPGGKVGQH